MGAQAQAQAPPGAPPPASIPAGPAPFVPPVIDFYARHLPVTASKHWSVRHLELAIRDDLRKTMKREPPQISMRMSPGNFNLDKVNKSEEISKFGALSDDKTRANV